MTTLRGLSALVLLFVLAWSGRAVAQSESEGDLIHRGVGLRATGDDTGALALFVRAYEIAHSARAAAQMGMAEQALGRWVDAERHLHEAMANASDPWIRSHRAVLNEALTVTAGHIGSLEVLGGVPGAEVRVDQRAAASLPMQQPVRVAAGTVTVEVRAPGYQSVERRVSITGGSLARETIDLTPIEREPSAAPVTQASPSPPPSAAPAPEPAPSPVIPVREVSRAHNGRMPLIVAGIAATVLVVGLGAGANIERETLVGWYVSPECTANGLTRMDNCGYLLPQVNAAQDVAIVGYAVGAALGIVTIVLIATAPSTHRDTRAEFGCSPDLARVGFACGGRF